MQSRANLYLNCNNSKLQKYIDFADAILFVLGEPGAAPLVHDLGRRNLPDLVTLHDCFIHDRILTFDPATPANALVGDPPLDCAGGMRSAGSDRDLGRAAGLA